jgi:hypothetical protein
MNQDTSERDRIISGMSGRELAEYLRIGGELPGHLERQRRAEAIRILKEREGIPRGIDRTIKYLTRLPE